MRMGTRVRYLVMQACLLRRSALHGMAGWADVDAVKVLLAAKAIIVTATLCYPLLNDVHRNFHTSG